MLRFHYGILSVLMMALVLMAQATNKEELKKKLLQANPLCSLDFECNTLYYKIDADTSKSSETPTNRTPSGPHNATGDGGGGGRKRRSLDDLGKEVDNYIKNQEEAKNKVNDKLTDLQKKYEDPNASEETKKKILDQINMLNKAKNNQSLADMNQALHQSDRNPVDTFLKADEEQRTLANAIVSEIKKDVTAASYGSTKKKEYEILQKNLENALKSNNKDNIDTAITTAVEYMNRRKDLTTRAYEKIMKLTEQLLDAATDKMHNQMIKQCIKEIDAANRLDSLDQLEKSLECNSKTDVGPTTVPKADNPELMNAIAALQSWVAYGNKEKERQYLLKNLETAAESNDPQLVARNIALWRNYNKQKQDLEINLSGEIHYIDRVLSRSDKFSSLRYDLEMEKEKLSNALREGNNDDMDTVLKAWLTKSKDYETYSNDNNQLTTDIKQLLQQSASMTGGYERTKKSIELQKYKNNLNDALVKGDYQTGANAIRAYDKYIADRTKWENQIKDRITKYNELLKDKGVDLKAKKLIEKEINTLNKALKEEDIAGMQKVYMDSNDELLLSAFTGNNSNDYYYDYDWSKWFKNYN